MLSMRRRGSHLQRQDDRVIIHFDYDCFYASVFEAEDPSLRSRPLAVQQKQIIVTCNYEARRRGLHKLQLIGEAKKLCPEVVIVLGEDLTRFRDASKVLYTYLRAFSWSDQAERLGLDEVFLDVSDIVTFNAELLNRYSLATSFFHLDGKDPTAGFAFDATAISGHTFPLSTPQPVPRPASAEDGLWTRLMLGSHLAHHLRHQLTADKGFTATVGISTNKLLAKLVGNVNKPRSQTTLIPPYVSFLDSAPSNVTTFLDGHSIGQIPGIGFKMAQKLRTLVRPGEPAPELSLVHGNKDAATVRDVRLLAEAGPELMERVLGGPGAPRDIGTRVWQLLHGIDDSAVGLARTIPSQISIEDSYRRLDRLDQVKHELRALTASLIRRMRIDLTEADDNEDDAVALAASDTPHARRWLAHPRTLRLSTRPCVPLFSSDSARVYHSRSSLSTPLPSFVFALREPVEALAARLVDSDLLRLFRRLHSPSERGGWAVSLLNVAVVGMVLAGEGRDIAQMMRQREDSGDSVIKETEAAILEPASTEKMLKAASTESEILEAASIEAEMLELGHIETVQDPRDAHGGNSASSELRKRKREMGRPEAPLAMAVVDDWESGDDDDDSATAAVVATTALAGGTGDEEVSGACSTCGARMPSFAMAAHARFHSQPD